MRARSLAGPTFTVEACHGVVDNVSPFQSNELLNALATGHQVQSQRCRFNAGAVDDQFPVRLHLLQRQCELVSTAAPCTSPSRQQCRDRARLAAASSEVPSGRSRRWFAAGLAGVRVLPIQLTCSVGQLARLQRTAAIQAAVQGHEGTTIQRLNGRRYCRKLIFCHSPRLLCCQCGLGWPGTIRNHFGRELLT